MAVNGYTWLLRRSANIALFFALVLIFQARALASDTAIAGMADPILVQALDPNHFRGDFHLKIRTWLFPESRLGPVKAVFAVQIGGIEAGELNGGEFGARVIADDNAEVLNNWSRSISDDGQFTWFQTVRLPAGSYTLGVAAVARDRRVGNSFYKFRIGGEATAASLESSSLLLTAECEQNQIAEGRQDLFNPLRYGSCTLVPEVIPQASEKKPLHVLFRLYTHESSGLKQFPESWRAWVEVRDNEGHVLMNEPTAFSYCSPRGWGVQTLIRPDKLALKPGLYFVAVQVASSTEKQRYVGVDSFRVQ